MSPRPSSSLQTACVSRLCSSGMRSARALPVGAFSLLSSRRVATVSLISDGEQRTLQAEHLLGRRVVGLRRAVAAAQRFPAFAEVGAELPLQRRRDAEAVGREQAAGDQVERVALLGRRHRRERVAPGARRVAHRADAADLARQHVGRARDVAQRVADRALEDVVVLVRAERPALLALEQLLGDADALLRERDDVAAEVELQRLGIDADEVVLVGAVGEQRLGAARRDLLERSTLFGRRQSRRQRLVRVLDRPVVVRPERVAERRAVALARLVGSRSG